MQNLDIRKAIKNLQQTVFKPIKLKRAHHLIRPDSY